MRRVLYFVGAGLSKALELPPKRIPLMADFLATMADHLHNHVVQVGFVHFARQHALPWPLVTELRKFVDKVAGHAKPDSAELAEVKKLVKRLPAKNIEALLSESPEMKNRVSFLINAIFCEIGWNVDWSSIDRFLTNNLRETNAEHTFVCFNYDLLLDRRIQDLSPGLGLVWNPLYGYGFTARRALGTVDIFDTDSAPGDRTDCDERNIRILKPHGSLNWAVSFENNYQFVDEQPRIICGDDGSLAYWPDYDVGLQYSVFLIPPMEAKASTLSFIRRVLDLEREAVRNADEVYVLGWSMPITDTDQVCLVRDAVLRREKPLERLTIVNCGAQIEYFDRVASTFGVRPAEIRVFNAGFSDFVQTL
jgi:hypothetical protein